MNTKADPYIALTLGILLGLYYIYRYRETLEQKETTIRIVAIGATLVTVPAFYILDHAPTFLPIPYLFALSGIILLVTAVTLLAYTLALDFQKKSPVEHEPPKQEEPPPEPPKEKTTEEKLAEILAKNRRA